MNGLVYFIQQDVTWVVKIGWTANERSLRERVAGLQTGSAYQLRVVHHFPGSVETEQGMHLRFAADRLMGEWFRPSVQMAELISDHRRAAARLLELTA